MVHRLECSGRCDRNVRFITLLKVGLLFQTPKSSPDGSLGGRGVETERQTSRDSTLLATDRHEDFWGSRGARRGVRMRDLRNEIRYRCKRWKKSKDVTRDWNALYLLFSTNKIYCNINGKNSFHIEIIFRSLFRYSRSHSRTRTQLVLSIILHIYTSNGSEMSRQIILECIIL